MMAVEENDFQSNKTDASLYNGRPTDTGAQCHSVTVLELHPARPPSPNTRMGCR